MKPGDVVSGRFHVERLVGRGGMGEVFRGRDAESGRDVALKSITSTFPGAAARFEREALVLARLDHPGIVRYVAHGADASGEPFLAMEWLDGEDLSTHVARVPLTVAEALEVVRRAADALGAAHAQGVVHRDVKPSNVFLVGGRTDGVRILDFGVARARDLGRTTTEGSVVGTLAYMAPEQARATAEVDARADVFALGCVLFECLAGRPAFAGVDIPTLLMKIVLDEPPLLRDAAPGVPPAVEALVARLLAKSPAGRPANGAEVARAIANLGAGDAPDVTLERTRLSDGEARWIGLVVAAGPPPEHGNSTDATTVLADARATELALSTFGARVERLADGALLAVVTGGGAPRDLAERSARIAEAVRRELPDAPIAIAFGRSEESEDLPVGEVVERAARELRRARKLGGPGGAGVAMDESTARMLDARFEVKAAAPRRASEPPVSSLAARSRRRTPFVGRGPELAGLEAIWRETVEESVARAALVVGDAGAGKSRLCDEFLRSVTALAPTRLASIGAGQLVGEGAAFGLVAALVADAAGVLDGEPLDARQAKLAALVDRSVEPEARARVTAFLAELVGAPFADESVELRAARTDARLMSDQLRGAVADLVAGACRERPLLLVLEDVHWGDRASLDVIGHALGRLDGQPLMVLALARPGGHDLPASWVQAGLREVRLAPLAKRSAEAVIRAFASPEASADAVAAMIERGGGNPFALEELARANAAGRTAVPDTVLAMTQARLDALDPAARRTLRAASVFGQVFWSGGVACLLGDDRRDTGRALDRLVTDDVLIETSSKFPGERAFAFQHAIVREAAYAMLTDADGALGHRLAAAWSLRHGETNPRVLAHHFERGRQKESAATWWCRAARDALRAGDVAATLELVDRGLACTSHGQLRAELLLLRADASFWSGEEWTRSSAADAAMEAATRGSSTWEMAAAAAALSAATAGETDTAWGLVQVILAERERARAAEPAPATIGAGAPSGDREMRRLSALLRVARALYIANDRVHGDAIVAATGAADNADPLVRAWWASARSIVVLHDGDAFGAMRAAELAMECFDKVGDTRSALHTRAHVANSLRELGAYERAAAEFEAIRDGARRAGLTPLAGNAILNLGIIRARLGAHADAHRSLDAAAGVFDKLGHPRLRAATRNYLAEALLLAGDLDASEAAARDALLLGAEYVGEVCYAKGLLARVALARGDAAAARGLAEEAVAVADGGDVDEGDAMVRLALAEALHATGDLPRAAHVIAEARARLLARAEHVADLALRATFLVDVAENAKILALADAWGVPEVRSTG